MNVIKGKRADIFKIAESKGIHHKYGRDEKN